MDSRLLLLLVILGLAVGLVFGILAMAVVPKPEVILQSEAVQLSTADQDDFIIMVAEAYSDDRQLKLAQDRLARREDQAISTRVEKLAINYAPQHDVIAARLALLAVALGSSNPTLKALSATATPTVTPTSTSTATSTSTSTSTSTPTFTPTDTPTSTSTATSTSTRLPPTATPTPTSTATPTPTIAPPPPVEWLPDPSHWPGTVHFYPADVAPGQGYWHLVKVVYCDAFDKSDPRKHDFDCDQLPGGPTGTSIYVMTDGAPIDVIRPDGKNVADDRTVVGDKKSPTDMCNCTYTFESSAYRISVRGAPSDAIDGFCLCSFNFGWGSHAHVRFFLYFKYITR